MKGILFNIEMVRAILDGQKTQTRRPIDSIYQDKKLVDISFDLGYPASIGYVWAGFDYCDDGDPIYCRGQYVSGDILYVRETFAVGKIAYGEEPDGREVPYISQCKGENNIIPKEWAIRNNIGIEEVKWKPSIHMPKEAARIFLKVTDVRVERVQEIGMADAFDEGFEGIGEFEDAWLDIYGDNYRWDTNPWIWIIEFERCEKPDEN